MKIKIWIVFLVLLLLGVGIYVVKTKSNSKEIFGINDKEYKILEKKNTLKLFKYDGVFYEKLNIKEEQLEEFIDQVSILAHEIPKEEMFRDDEIEYFERVIMNAAGLNIKDVYKLYCKVSKPNRLVLASKPITVFAWTIISKSKDGTYDVYLWYVE